jgi:hypothetical protein
MSARRPLSVLALLLLASCTYYSAVSPGPTAIKGMMTVQPGLTWAKVDRATPDNVIFSNGGQVETWTIDGETLDSLVFFAGVADGAPLVELPSANGAPLSPFHSTMTANDVMDLFETMVTRVTGSAVARTRDLRPAKLGNADGFRFEIDYALKDDVDRTLSAVGAIRNGKLYLIAFQGSRLYHYQKYLPEFEKIVASATFSQS